ncbi:MULTISPECIES: hypothetical protein [Bacillus cereus group]|uniref:hypothetical protein n=1 Tax=Bacillus cereus group TaxID=86661 RepID=UPI0013E92BC7|nr:MULTISPECIES: hypothetical protein [Bacillus cereus group]
MKKFKPAFEVTQVGSMQWNRTNPGSIVEATNQGKAVDIPQDVLEQVKNAIKAEISKG